MIVCLDTNTVVQAPAEGHPCHPILEAWVEGKLTWVFTDCAVTAGADYLITEDQHFTVLANAGYKPQPVTLREFIVRFIVPTI